MNQSVGFQVAHPRPHVSPTPIPEIEKSPFQISANQLEISEMSIEHIRGHISFLWSNAMNSRTAFAKAPNEWTHTEHNMCGRRSTWSPLCWWPWYYESSLLTPNKTNIKLITELQIFSGHCHFKRIQQFKQIETQWMRTRFVFKAEFPQLLRLHLVYWITLKRFSSWP